MEGVIIICNFVPIMFHNLMKQKDIFIAALLLMLAGAKTAWAQKVVLYKTNGETIKFNVSELDSLVFEEIEPVLGARQSRRTSTIQVTTSSTGARA